MVAAFVLLSAELGVGRTGEFVKVQADPFSTHNVAPDVPVFCVAAVPKPKFVLAVDAEAKSERLFATFAGVKPKLACLPLRAV